MDKNRKISADIAMENHLQVHRFPSHRSSRKIHDDYGLYIFRGSQGHATPPSESPEAPRYFEFYAISHLYRGRGFYWRPEQGVRVMEPGQCVLVSPRTIHNYGGWQDFYCEDSINFTGALADRLKKSGVLTDGVFELGSPRRLLPILELAADPSDHAQINANFELQKLLLDLYNRRFQRRSADRHPEITELLRLLREHPQRDMRIGEMAEFCNLSDDQFRRIFRQRVGLLPKLYLDQLKMKQAASLLSDTSLSIGEIAAKTGYSDAFHFSRRFKEIIGMAPGRYRRTLPE